MAEVKVVCGALVVKGNKLVLVQEKCTDYGKWNFPAGHLDLDEDILSATKREVKEETNLDVKLDGLLGIYQHKNKNGDNVVRILFKASVVRGKLKHQQEELLDAKWFSFEDFAKMKDQELRSLDLRLAVDDFRKNKIKSLDTVKFLVNC